MNLHKLPHKQLIITALVVIAVLVLGWIGYLWYKSVTVNYAQEVARPIEEGLVRAGARKMCSTGDAGRGPDNRTPWYRAYYSIAQSREETSNLIHGVARASGYSLVSVDDGNTADQFKATDINYFDASSKLSPYSNLQPGKVGIAFGLYNDGAREIGAAICDTAAPVAVVGDASNSVIELQTKLPNYK